jgi:L-amino acid N-acyltransferase YncA
MSGAADDGTTAEWSTPMAISLRIRRATEGDADAVATIYRPYVEGTAISFETVPPTTEEMRERIAKSLAHWDWLVAEEGGQCVGYAYGSSHRARAAYRYSAEVSAYLQPSHQGQGLGRRLYAALFDSLAVRGYCNALAGVALPNDASVRLHRSVGFQPIGVFHAVGRKFGRWHDVAWYERRLRDEPRDD